MKIPYETKMQDVKHYVRVIRDSSIFDALCDVGIYAPINEQDFGEYVVIKPFLDTQEIVSRKEIQFFECEVTGYEGIYVPSPDAIFHRRKIVGHVVIWKGDTLVLANILADYSVYIFKSRKKENRTYAKMKFADHMRYGQSQTISHVVAAIRDKADKYEDVDTALLRDVRGGGLSNEGSFKEKLFAKSANVTAAPKAMPQTFSINYSLPAKQTCKSADDADSHTLKLARRVSELETEVADLRSAIAAMGKDFNTILNEIKELI